MSRAAVSVRVLAVLVAAAGLGEPALAQERRERAPQLVEPPPRDVRAVQAGQEPDEARSLADVAAIPPVSELQAVPIGPELESCLQRLGDPDFAVREEAMAELMDSTYGDVQIYAVLATRELSAEQRHRLVSIAMDRLLYAPLGAVGIRADQQFLPDKIVIQELLPDLPARRVLLVGDRITHLDGQLLSGWQEFMNGVQSRWPGTRIKLTVERPDDPAEAARQLVADRPLKVELIEVEMELGSANLLPHTPEQRPALDRSPVQQIRRNRAAEVMEQFGPRPHQIQVEG